MGNKFCLDVVVVVLCKVIRWNGFMEFVTAFRVSCMYYVQQYSPYIYTYTFYGMDEKMLFFVMVSHQQKMNSRYIQICREYIYQKKKICSLVCRHHKNSQKYVHSYLGSCFISRYI